MAYNYYTSPSQFYLEHHGIKGQKWGVRRFQNEDGSVTAAGAKRYYKEKAKTYEKGINDLLKKDSMYRLEYWRLKESKDLSDKKIEKLKNQEKDKIDKWITESKIMSMKMDEVNKRYSKNREEINSLINKIANDKDVVYTTSKFRVNSGYKGLNDFSKELSNKYRKSTYLSDGGQRSVDNDRLIVKAATNRNKNKKKFKDPDRKKLSDPRYTKTYTYYY